MLNLIPLLKSIKKDEGGRKKVPIEWNHGGMEPWWNGTMVEFSNHLCTTDCPGVNY